MKINKLFAALLAVSLVSACVQPPINTINPVSTKAVRVINVKSKTSLSGIVEFPDKIKLRLKAVLSEIAPSATVSLIDPDTNISIASGLTNANGLFTINPTADFSPTENSVYIVEVVKRHGGVGNSVIGLRTIVKWNLNGWSSITDQEIKINKLTTALSIIANLNSGFNSAELIGKVNASGAFTDYGSPVVTQAAIDRVTDIVTYTLEKDVDPLQYTKLVNGNYIPVRPPEVTIPGDTVPISGGSIIYVSTDCCSSSGYSIIMSGLDGSNPATLLENWPYYIDSGMMGDGPTFYASPDKSKIFFRANPQQGGDGGIFFLALSGGTEPVLLPNTSTYQIMAQAGGIIYLMDWNNSSNIRTLNMNSGTIEPLDLGGLTMHSNAGLTFTPGDNPKLVFKASDSSLYVKSLNNNSNLVKISGAHNVQDFWFYYLGGSDVFFFKTTGGEVYSTNFNSPAPVKISGNISNISTLTIDFTKNNPDKVIVTTQTGSVYDYYILSADGSPPVKINIPTTSYYAGTFKFSADFSKVVLDKNTVEGAQYKSEVFLANTANGNTIQVSNITTGDPNAAERMNRNPDITDDGSKVSWLHHEQTWNTSYGNSTYFIYDGTNTVADPNFTNSGFNTSYYTQFNDKFNLNFYVYQNNNNSQYIYYLKNSDLTRGSAIKWGFPDTYPNFEGMQQSSADPGKYFARSYNNGNHDIFSISLDGSDPVNLTNTPDKREEGFLIIE